MCFVSGSIILSYTLVAIRFVTGSINREPLRDIRMETSAYCMVITTAPDGTVASRLAEGLLQERLAACIHMQEIRSCYLWKDDICRDEETVMWIKTLEENYGRVEDYLKRRHPYDLPEIIKVPVTGGLPAYLDWIKVTATGSGAS